ncbi:MAG: 16S rRNA (adenine(1518)-N(6)/adenine(1519)-N(6))-dimethyltransferase RsmA [Pseudomonadales bacterium]|nr:16S rRNA (adenine(1518)-N(6)/adenine(1519)-N(6))-dimethyltransferase RsmA [Pseudomonadales bacterium]
MRARKRFGQNFLHDQNLIRKIVNAINPKPEDHVIEIGPGRGALTALLLKSGCQLDVIEIDRDLASELREKHPQLNVIESDVLKFDFSQIEGSRPLRIVGNLPYNISTPLLFKLFNQIDSIRDMYFMLQLEVVNRLTAEHSHSDYGRLSVMSQYYCQSEKLFTVPPEAFIPRPKVMSAIVRLTPQNKKNDFTDTEVLRKILIQAFSMRRKTIRNALKGYVTAEDIIALGLDPRARPENLSLSNYIAIAKTSTLNL